MNQKDPTFPKPALIVESCLRRLRDLVGDFDQLPAAVGDELRILTRDLSGAEHALRESEARLRAVVNTAVDGIVTIDERGVIESVNPAVERIFGYTPDEVIGRNVGMFMPNPYRDSHDTYLQRYLDTGERRIIGIGREVVGLRKDGTTFPLDLAVSELRIGDRRLFTGIVRDITDRKRLEREVLEISTQEQQRIGRDLHDGLGQELTGIALLGGVIQRKLAAQGAPEAKEIGEVVTLVNDAISHTRALVRGLCPVRSDADGLMAAMQDLAETITNVHGVACTFECDEPVVINDYQTVTNLYYIAHEAANNAMKHAQADRLELALKIDDEGRVTLSIADNGKGMPSRMPRDAGRGLHIMNYRARMVGGVLRLETEPGRGTTIACTFHPGHASAERQGVT
ncbi:MAG: PAS domain S-box protein [Phycisphaera sp.]|nr:PAS domain S-box protein [Phycisphaera sp.]